MIENLYRDYHDKLLWFCINLSGTNSTLAEDIVQDTFIRGLENIDVLNNLTDDKRELFWLRYMEGYNSSELGRLFDLPASSVRAGLASARKKITKVQ